MAFHDVRLPENVERGASGGPRFKTTLISIDSGFESRTLNWLQTRGEWDIGYPARSTITNLRAVRDFFYCRMGRAHSFRFKDWSDYIIGDPDTDTDQTIGVGDGSTTQFQIEKRYISVPIQFTRTVTKPVEGTVRVFITSVEQFSGFTVDFTTGIITFTSPPADTAPIGVICEYDVPVRFEADELNMSMTLETVGFIPSIRLVEVHEDTTFVAALREPNITEQVILHEVVNVSLV